MSHIRCALCGKNAPISTFDPSSLDLDLRVVSFKGLGRARGFAVDEEYSVLGDDVYSPIVADRVLDLCRMYLDHGVIDSEQTIKRLGLDSVIKTPSVLPKIAQPPIRQAELASSFAQMAQARETIEQQRKELALERLIDSELVKFVKYYPHVGIYENELPWSIVITDIDEECLPLLIALFETFNHDERRILLKRVNTIHPVVQKFLEALTIRKKTISEILLELDFELVFERFDLGVQENISKRRKASEPTDEKTLEKTFNKKEKSIAERLLELDPS